MCREKHYHPMVFHAEVQRGRVCGTSTRPNRYLRFTDRLLYPYCITVQQYRRTRGCRVAWVACQRARLTGPTVLAREMHRPALRPPRSTIMRLRSGAVASRVGAFRIAAFRFGAGEPRGWHGRACVRRLGSLRPRATAWIPPAASRCRWGASGSVACASVAIRNPLGRVFRIRAADVAPAPLAFAASLARCSRF